MDEPADSELPYRGNELLITQLVLLVVAGIATLVRAYIKLFLVKRTTWDDYLIFFAMALQVAYGTVGIDGVVNGATGKPVTHGYSADEAARSLRAWYICEALYAPLTLSIRASCCIVLFRIAVNRIHHWIIWINFGIITTVSVIFCFVLLFQCSPPSYYWEQVYDQPGTCMDKGLVKIFVSVHSIASALSDWCLGLLPIALLWNVKINRRTKASIAFLLSLGMVAGVVLIVRIPFVTKIKPSREFLYDSIDVAIWSCMEPPLGITAACLATWRPLFKQWGIGWNTSKKSTSSGNVLSRRRTGHWALSSDGNLNSRGVNSHRRTCDETSLSEDGQAGPRIKINKTVEIEISSMPSSARESGRHSKSAEANVE